MYDNHDKCYNIHDKYTVLRELYMQKLSYERLLEEFLKLQDEVRYFQEYDAMTNILNKSAFYIKAKDLLQKQVNIPYMIVSIDVERFKLVNDLYGTDKGNDLLIYLATTLQEKIITENGLIARLSADVFAACIPVQDINDLVDTIVTIFKKAPLEMEINPAIGIFQIQDACLQIETMCDRSILALRTIKGNYQKHYAIYTQAMWDHLLEEQELRSQAETALNNHEFQIYMQPKCDMRTSKIVGAEALVRWIHPNKGLIPPNLFIPLFEKNGFIKQLDAYVWEEVIKWSHDQEAKGLSTVPVSVNVSRLDIIGLNVPKTIQDLLQKYNVHPSKIQLEITESAYTSQFSEIASTIETLMDSGHIVLMDDFGSGYSSLNMLKDINIDVLKLDLRFLDSTNQKSKDIIESIIHMAKWLHLKVIAEGVETKEQESFLLSIGCQYAQGYLYYKPMPTNDFNTLLSQDNIVQFEQEEALVKQQDTLINFKNLFHHDLMSQIVLNNILGAIAIYEYHKDHLQIINCNEEYLLQTAKPLSLLLQKEYNLVNTLHEDDQQKLMDTLILAKSRGDIGATVVIRKMVNDTYIWFEFRLFYLANSRGKEIYYAGITNINDHMEFIERLRLSEQRFRIAMEASSSTLFELDIETRVASFAKHTQEEFGLNDTIADAPEGFIQQGSIVAGYEDTFREIYNRIYQGENYASGIIQANMGNGKIVWNKITLIAVKNKKGETLKAVGLVENVSHEMNSEPTYHQ